MKNCHLTQYNQRDATRYGKPMKDFSLSKTPLGHKAVYPDHYDSSLLFPIARQTNRAELPFVPRWMGNDIWNAYEISWLNSKGKPLVGTAQFVFPEASPCLIESKSFKLYLNSFNEAKFDNIETVQGLMEHDLSQAAGAPVTVRIDLLDSPQTVTLQTLSGITIDDLDVTVERYERAPDLLCCQSDASTVSETLVCNLLKSNCPVTGQPDWGSVQIRYEGPQIDRRALLLYIISLRRHREFHEHCVEQMYCDIWRACQPMTLAVYARYTRRGGLDINPWRASQPVCVNTMRTIRQ